MYIFWSIILIRMMINECSYIKCIAVILLKAVIDNPDKVKSRKRYNRIYSFVSLYVHNIIFMFELIFDPYKKNTN